MSFKYSCIGDNTPENREHLELLGWKPSKYHHLDKEYLFTSSLFSGCVYGSFARHNIERYSSPEHVIGGRINCIGNPQLFQAVSAMRDDSDYMQFFVSKGWRDYYDDPIPDKWVLCTSDTLEEFGNVNNSPNSYSIPSFGWRKVSLSELQAHFQRV